MAVLPVELVCAPRGLGTAAVESLSGYCARLSANVAVPTGLFVKRALDGVVHQRQRKSINNVVVSTRAGTMNGCGDLACEVEEGIRNLTDLQGLRRLSYWAFVDAFGFAGAELLSPLRRWCSRCWADDGEEPYERKAWWLAIVDACPVHKCLLDSRCPTCARTQPALPRGVRLHVCSYCGHDLLTDSVPLQEGRAAERLLWYAREGTLLVHIGEVASLIDELDDVDGPAGGYPRLARKARERGFPAVERFFVQEVHAKPGVQLEKLMSALWRLDASVLDLFSDSIRASVETTGKRQGI